MDTVIYGLTFIIIIYFLLLSLGYTLLLLFSFRDIYDRFTETEYIQSTLLTNQKQMVPVTVIMPVYNAEKTIINAVYGVLQSDYKNLYLILVNDASTDGTMKALCKDFNLFEKKLENKAFLNAKPIITSYGSKNYSNLWVLDTQHSGSSDSINAGLNVCQTPLFMTIDSDTVVQPDSISNMVFTYMSHGHTKAIGGGMFIINACQVEHGVLLTKIIPRRFFEAQQFCEYLRAFLYGRAGWERFGGTLCYPGAFSLFETQAVLNVGGYDPTNYSYDADIIMQLHAFYSKRHLPYQIHFSPNAYAWTQGPSNFKTFWRQRNHWQRGMLRSSMRNIRMLFNPRYGLVGLFNYPYYVCFEVFGPVVEFLSYFLFFISWYLGIVQPGALFYYFILACVFNTFLTMACIFINALTFHTFRKLPYFFKILPISLVQMFGYRQLISCCCAFATAQYFFNRLLKRPQ